MNLPHLQAAKRTAKVARAKTAATPAEAVRLMAEILEGDFR